MRTITYRDYRFNFNPLTGEIFLDDQHVGSVGYSPFTDNFEAINHNGEIIGLCHRSKTTARSIDRMAGWAITRIVNDMSKNVDNVKTFG